MLEPICLTFLTCKRYELFERTFLSFVKNCKDMDLVRFAILVDDNSSQEDRNKMQGLLDTLNVPNLLVSKNNLKGQAHSLNILSCLANTRYSFHIEDDWAFCKEGHFLRDSLKVMKSNENIRRVCVDASSSGKNLSALDEEVKTLDNGATYFVHNNKKMNEWPSFTFRQCLIDNTANILIGAVRSKPELSHDGSPPTAETDFAVRYCEQGYLTAFLMDKYCEEISVGKPSAFTLNQVSRYKES